MSTIEKSELKRIVAAMKNRRFSAVPPNDLNGAVPSRNRRAMAKMMDSAAAKVGLDVSKMNKLLADDQKAMQGAFEKERATAKKRFPAAEAAFRSGMAQRLKALGLLSTPFTSSLVTLEKPFLIWQMPRPDLSIFIDSNIESMNSSVKVLVDVISGSNFTQLIFFYIWRNPSDFFAVANVDSSLIVNGACSVQAKPGIFSGDTATLNMAATLTLMRWNGWGTDPVTGESIDQTPDPNFQQGHRKQIASLQAKGGHIFQSADFKSQSFSFEPFPLGHDLFVIPGNAVVLFEVGLELSYGFDGGGDIQDRISVDFANNGGSIFCPNVELEILTPLPNLTVA